MQRPATATLVRKVRAEFPTLTFTSVRRSQTGIDHDVLFLDEKLVFRFPRDRAYKKTLAAEMRLLEKLAKRRLPFALPRYRYIAHDKTFGGYDFIPGEKLTRETFKKLSPAAKARFYRELGAFLTTLHRLPTRGAFTGDMRKPWNLDRYRERYQEKRRAVVKRAVSPQLLRRIDDFFETTYRSITRPPVKTVIHSDLRDEHILMDSKTGTIAGIIDFGDSAIGDPAFDFTCIWDFDDAAASGVYEVYTGPRDDMFLCRSRIHYLRWVVDELYHAVKKRDSRREKRLVRTLEANLPVLCIVS